MVEDVCENIYNRGEIATSELRIVFSSSGLIQMTCLL